MVWLRYLLVFLLFLSAYGELGYNAGAPPCNGYTVQADGSIVVDQPCDSETQVELVCFFS